MMKPRKSSFPHVVTDCVAISFLVPSFPKSVIGNPVPLSGTITNYGSPIKPSGMTEKGNCDTVCDPAKRDRNDGQRQLRHSLFTRMTAF